MVQKDMTMHRIVAKFIQRLLTNDQKKHRINTCKEELENLASKDEDFC